jgi:hypothetical protein
MERQVFLFDIEGKEALGFDTGHDSRAFARARFDQFITEPGFIVSLEGPASSVKFWKADGVAEHNTMVVWGPPFKGDRLDLLLHDNNKRNETLAAIRLWIQATHGLGKEHTVPLWPCSVLIGGSGGINEVFFAPPSLAQHCLMAEESNKINNRYVHPDLNGMNAAAFTAAAMLYLIFTGASAFSAMPGITDDIVLHEDMREGNFLPVRLAAPGLDDKLAALIQRALDQNAKKDGLPNGERLLEEFIAILRTDSPDSFFKKISEADILSIEKEKTQYLKTKTASVKTRRFVTRNAALLIGSFAALVIAVLIANSVIRGRSALSTKGMEPVQVIESYYNAFGELNHQWMEACVINKAGKDDINMVTGYFLIGKIRQAYEHTVSPFIISAKEWLESGGGQVSLLVFGVTDIQITGNGEERYRVDYTLWIPDVDGDSPQAGNSPPNSFHHTDYVTLVQKRGRWRISEIVRNR